MYRIFLIGLIAACTSMTWAQTGPSAGDDAYPAKPIRVVYPAAAGGAVDPLLRVIMEEVSKIVGQPIIVDNKPGGNYTIAGKAVLMAPPDGYTLLMSFPGHITMKSFVKLPYDPIKDFTPVAKVLKSSYWFVIDARLPVNTFKEFVEYAKTHHVTHGTLAVGSTGHVFAERLNAFQGTKLISAPYRSDGAIVNDMLGGEIGACFCSLPATVQHIKAGKLRLLGTTASERAAAFPDIPTFRELGFTGNHFNYQTWLGLFAPEKTPPERWMKFASALRTVMQRPSTTAYLQTFMMTPDYQDSAEFHAFLVKTFAEWDSDVKKTNIKIQ